MLSILRKHGFTVAAAPRGQPRWWLLGFTHAAPALSPAAPLEHEDNAPYHRTLEALCYLMGHAFGADRTWPKITARSLLCFEDLLPGQSYTGSECDHPLWRHFVATLRNAGVPYEGRQNSGLIAAMAAPARKKATAEVEKLPIAARMAFEWFVPHIQDVQQRLPHADPKLYVFGAAHVPPVGKYLDALRIPYVGMVQATSPATTSKPVSR